MCIFSETRSFVLHFASYFILFCLGYLEIFCFKELPRRDFLLEASYPTYHSDISLFIVAGVAPGNFGRGLILPKRGLKYGFQGTINTKNRRKNRFFNSRKGVECSDGRAIA